MVFRLAACAAALAVAAGAAFEIDGTAADLVYDGHGALSAGASSRLLIDYDAETRSEILDLLFKPNYGAAMHLIKVEIGGDGQSTDGTEASHMHYRDDLSCKRGYEFWLLEEARKRNPEIKTYVLSWALPHWVGNQTGFFSDDTIDYNIKFLKCTKQWNIGNIDYIGNWNERPHGSVEWNLKLKAAMVTAGFADTEIVIPDGGGMSADIATGFSTNPAYKEAVYAIGQHYPCDSPEPDIVNKYHKKFWSSEDYSTVGNWAGAACWGRILNQNFVRMNQTSTISWSLIWSVYETGFPYFGNGLMYAMTPWSGYYEAGQAGTDNGVAIWTNAHVCQFTKVGWKYVPVGQGSGMLANGGSYVSMVSADGTQVTVVAEKLEGRCLRCAGQKTEAETAHFKLGAGLGHVKTLQIWSTNETARFQSLGNVSVGADGTFSVAVGADSIVTASSWYNGQAKGAPRPVAPNTAFPLPYSDSFDAYAVDSEARYFADNGGSFQIAPNPAGTGMVMKQWAKQENGVNRWGGNFEPVSLIGNASWADVEAAVSIMIGEAAGPPPPPPPPPPAPIGPYFYWQSAFNEQCLDVQGHGPHSGGVLDTWSCVNGAQNEEFEYQAATGHLIEKEYGNCVVEGTACGAGAGFCTRPCAEGTAWTVGADNTIRPTASPGQCITVASKVLDATLSLSACSTPPLPQQIWKNISSPPPPPPGKARAGLCVRADRSGSGVCVNVFGDGSWSLSGAGAGQSGQTKNDPTKAFVKLGLKATGADVTVTVDGVAQPTAAVHVGAAGLDVKAAVRGTAGMVAIVSGFNVAYFDDFAIAATD